jgi:hypothetical protein
MEYFVEKLKSLEEKHEKEIAELKVLIFFTSYRNMPFSRYIRRTKVLLDPIK